MVRANLPPGLPISELVPHLEGYIVGLKNSLFKNIGDDDRARNEIRLFDDETGVFNDIGQWAFRQIALDVANSECWFMEDATAFGGFRFDYGTLMCAQTSERNPGYSVDVLIRRSAFKNDALALPASDPKFNKCGNNSDSDNSAYSSFLHEVGHVLGLAHPLHVDYTHLPTFNSIMNYSSDGGECAPHPLDVMAIYALYQTRFTTNVIR